MTDAIGKSMVAFLSLFALGLCWPSRSASEEIANPRTPTSTASAISQAEHGAPPVLSGEKSQSLEVTKTLLEIVKSCAELIGIPWTVYVFFRERRKERRLRELEAFIKSNDQYMAYLDKVVEYPEENFGEFRTTDKELAETGFSVRKFTLFTQLILILERAWVVYYRLDLNDKRDLVWGNWEATFAFWAEREDFRKAWASIDPNVEPTFRSHMDHLIKKAAIPQVQPPSNGDFH